MTSCTPPSSRTLRRTSGTARSSCIVAADPRRSSIVSSSVIFDKVRCSVPAWSLNNPAYLASRYSLSMSLTLQVIRRTNQPNARRSMVSRVSASILKICMVRSARSDRSPSSAGCSKGRARSLESQFLHVWVKINSLGLSNFPFVAEHVGAALGGPDFHDSTSGGVGDAL